LTTPIDPELWRVDLSTVAVLAAVLWLDGWRRLPDDALVVRRVLFGPWRVAAPSARLGSFAFLAWWPPLVIPYVVGTATPDSQPRWTFDVGVARATRRLHRVRWDVGVVRFLGAFLVFWIALVIPLLTARSGVEGLVRGIASAFLLAATVAVLTMNALRSLGLRWRRAVRRAVPLFSPFGASRAPEIVIDAAMMDVGPLAMLRALQGDEAFRSWLRPFAYDELHGRQAWPATGALPRAVLEHAVAAPDASTERYCARCGRTYRHDVTICSDCADTPLSF
jgi:hypothetical protein